MEVELSEDADRINWQELAQIFALTPLGPRDPKRLEAAFRNSAVCCFAYHEGTLIGTGRALSDRIAHTAIYDVVVHPDFQGKSVGSQMMRFLIDTAGTRTCILFAAPGKEGFYEKLGFSKMKTAMAILPNPEWQRENGYIE